MVETLLCLDIHEEMVIAVAMQCGGGSTRITGSVQVKTIDQSFAAAIDQIRRELSGTPGKCRVTIGAELFSFRNVTLPFTEKKKIVQVLPMELAEQIPVEIDTLLLDYVVTKAGPQGVEILAAMIERVALAERLAVLRAAGMEPEFIGVSGMDLAWNLIDRGERDCILLDSDKHWATLFLIREGRVATIRSFKGRVENDGLTGIDERLELFGKQTLLGCRFPELRKPGCTVYYNGPPPLLSTMFGLSVKKYGTGLQPSLILENLTADKCRSECRERAVACGLGSGKSHGVLNFCKEEFRREKTFHDYRRRFLLLGAPVLLGCILGGLYLNHDYQMMAAQQEGLRRQITEVFTATVPTVTRIVQPVQQLQVIINEAKAMYRSGGISSRQYSVIELLTEISSRIPPTYSVRVVRFVAETEALLLKAVTGDFNTVDNIQKELKKSPLFKEVVISSASQAPQGDEVSFELKLVLAGQ
ncbi:MAG: PilN domain-containing protein [Pseudomonadota bacterium]